MPDLWGEREPVLPGRAETTVTVLEFLYLQRHVTQDGDGCWPWRGRVEKNRSGIGYGRYHPSGGRIWFAHRLAYVAWRGPIPAGMTVHHTCGNSLCCNPAHLELVPFDQHGGLSAEHRWSQGELPSPF